MPILVYILAFLMVSDVRYYSFKDMALFKGKPFRSTLAVILLLVIIFIEPKVTLFVLATMYLLSGPVFTLINSLINRKKSIPGEYPRLKEDPSERDGHL